MGWIALVALAYFALRKPPSSTTDEPPPEPPPPDDLPDCIATFRDGPYAICLYAGQGTRVRWRASLEDPVVDVPDVPVELGEPTEYVDEVAALVAAWQRLKTIAYGPNLTLPLAVSRWGLALGIDGEVSVSNEASYVNHASPLISQATQDGDDAGGIVLAVLIDIFGKNWNPFRAWVEVGGVPTGFDAMVARVQALPQLNPPMVARAIVGL